MLSACEKKLPLAERRVRLTSGLYLAKGAWYCQFSCQGFLAERLSARVHNKPINLGSDLQCFLRNAIQLIDWPASSELHKNLNNFIDLLSWSNTLFSGNKRYTQREWAPLWCMRSIRCRAIQQAEHTNWIQFGAGGLSGRSPEQYLPDSRTAWSLALLLIP